MVRWGRRLFYRHHFAVEAARYVVARHAQPVPYHLTKQSFECQSAAAEAPGKEMTYISGIEFASERFSASNVMQSPKTILVSTPPTQYHAARF